MEIARLQQSFNAFCKGTAKPTIKEAKERAFPILETECNVKMKDFTVIEDQFKGLRLSRFEDNKKSLIANSESEDGSRTVMRELELILSGIRKMLKYVDVTGVIESTPEVITDVRRDLLVLP